MLELVGGILPLVVTPAQIGTIARFLTEHELSEDPHDLIANSVLHLAGSLNLSVTLLGTIYLLLYGVVKLVLVWAVLREHLWAHPWLIAFLQVFIAYQGHETGVRRGYAVRKLGMAK